MPWIGWLRQQWKAEEIDSTEYTYEKGRAKTNNEIPPKAPKDQQAGYIHKVEIENANQTSMEFQ